MEPTANGGQHYEVHCSQAVSQQLHQLQQQSPIIQRQAITAAFRTIVERLEYRPFSVGEARYRLKILRLKVRTVSVRPLLIDYAVHEDRPLVFIKGVKLLPK